MDDGQLPITNGRMDEMTICHIYRIECIAHSSGVDQDVINATASAIASAAAVAAAAAPVAGPVGAAIGAALGAAKGLILAIPNLAAAIDVASDDPDQLYLSFQNFGDRDFAVWPNNRDHYYKIRAGQAVTVNLGYVFGQEGLDLNFWEWDVGPDDFLGRFSVNQGNVANGVQSQIVFRLNGGGAIYAVAYDVLDDIVRHGVQDHWRWCSRCQGLHFQDNGLKPCPAGGTHIIDQSGNYQLSLGDPQHPGQVWHWCSKCAGLHFTEHGLKPCPAGGVHEIAGTGDYRLHTVETNRGAPGQRGWRWCRKCAGMHFMGSNNPGFCPAGRGGHSMDGSGNYILPIVPER